MTVQSFAEQVFKEIDYFFSIGGSNDNDLLRIACLGNPERTIQGALFLHLSKRFHVVLEMKLNGKSLDIAVFKNNLSASPDVIIELKHRTPFQTGGFNSLLYMPPSSKGRHDMFHDYDKHRPEEPTDNTPALILIGTATTISCVISSAQALPFLNNDFHASNQKKLNSLPTLISNFSDKFSKKSPWPTEEILKWYTKNTLPKKCIPQKPRKCFYRLNSGTLGNIEDGQTPTSNLGDNIKGSVHAIGFMWDWKIYMDD